MSNTPRSYSSSSTANITPLTTCSCPKSPPNFEMCSYKSSSTKTSYGNKTSELLMYGDMRTRDLVLYCAGAGSRGLYIRHNIAESKADEVE